MLRADNACDHCLCLPVGHRGCMGAELLGAVWLCTQAHAIVASASCHNSQVAAPHMLAMGPRPDCCWCAWRPAGSAGSTAPSAPPARQPASSARSPTPRTWRSSATAHSRSAGT